MLSPYQLKRYSRNIALPEICQDGQESLLDASVLVVGAGGLGSPVMLYLASAGVGTIGVVDSDIVELSNLQRQVLYGENSIGKAKVPEAAQKIKELNSGIVVIAHQERLGQANIANIISRYDIIADCSDNFPTRFIINDTCVALKKTFVSGAVTGFMGHVATFKSHSSSGNPCYRCFCPAPPPEDLLPGCSNGGVLGSIAGVTGSIQATEIIKELLEIGTSLAGFMLIYDGIGMNIRKARLRKNPTCTVCNT